jgi:hypothetical protein
VAEEVRAGSRVLLAGARDYFLGLECRRLREHLKAGALSSAAGDSSRVAEAPDAIGMISDTVVVLPVLMSSASADAGMAVGASELMSVTGRGAGGC